MCRACDRKRAALGNELELARARGKDDSCGALGFDDLRDFVRNVHCRRSADSCFGLERLDLDAPLTAHPEVRAQGDRARRTEEESASNHFLP